ncbi:methionyl-tRNA formyltransferase [Nakamurella deserti]|uniref:methionyl-tRNA formyltransferase n=1 Tax=Nakamurella deserti TaxID=2164074 RepID=UPI000DBE7510
MRIVFAGTPEPAVVSLRALLDSGHEVLAVVTRPPAPTGRGRTLQPSPVEELARDRDLRVLTPTGGRDPELLDALTALAPDAAAVVAYGALLPQPVLDVPAHGWVNLHFSLLPAWRGAAPVYAAIRHGDDITGASTFRLEAGMDTGPVFGTVTEPIRPTDTTTDLLGRLSVSGAELLVRTLDGIADGTLEPVPQPPGGVSHAGKVTVADARIDWTTPAVAIDRAVRALTTEPGAWTVFRGHRLGLGPVERSGAPAGELAPGQLAVSKTSVLVGTATTPLRLGTVRPPGKRPMPAADWARGVRPGPEDRFTHPEEQA